MKTPSGYKGIILKYLESVRAQDPDGGWIKEGLLRSKETSFGWIGFRGDRDARQLYEKGFLEGGWDGKYRIVRWKLEGGPRTEKTREEREQLILSDPNALARFV